MYSAYFKRFFDIVGACILLTLLSPLLAAIYLLLLLNGENPLFFQQRVGKQERTFILIKFKSMRAVQQPGSESPNRSVQVTKIGRVLRKTSLDELPQLINVIKGDMSFIGPRPLFYSYLPYYSKTEQLRHQIRPGITGWAQVNGRNNVSWDTKLAMDIKYVKNLSFCLDCQILIKTVINVLRAKDITVEERNQMLNEERAELNPR